MNVLIAGDFCPRNRVSFLVEEEKYSSILSGVRVVVSESDYSIVNFECPVASCGCNPIPKLGPNLSCSENGLKAIRWVGFDCVTLANNHFGDYGDEGVINTIDLCRRLGLDTVGGGIDLADAKKVLYKSIRGQQLAIINCCEHEFSIATDTHCGSNPLEPIQQYYDIKEAKSRADYVLVIVHGGHELYQLPSIRMVETYRFFIDAGADAVINHHQHCFSGYETYKGKPIFYGLGNFCFDTPNHRNDIWNKGLILKLNLTEKIDFELFPIVQCSEKAAVELLDKGVYDRELEELNSTICDLSILKKENDKYYSSTSEHVSSIFEPIRSRFFLACKTRGLLPSLISKKRKIQAEDYICCESHRDKLIQWLKRKP